MKIYPELPRARAYQIATDLAVLVWVYMGLQLARWLARTVSSVAERGRAVEDAGKDLSGRFNDAGEAASRVPGIGRRLAQPFTEAADAADALAEAGTSFQETVHDAAAAGRATVIAVVLLVVLVSWLPRRIRWIRRATVGAQLRTAPAGRDLLALRALSSQSMRVLRAVNDDPAGGWRRSDPQTLEALAALELRSVGLRPLPPRRGSIAPSKT
jgi:hypothetical protein